MRQLLNTLFVTSEDIYLSLDGENVVANRDGETVARYPLHTLQSIVTFSYAGASPALMGKCAQREIGLVFCSQRGKFLARVSGQMQGNVLLRRMQYRVADDPPQSCRIARNMIFGKVYNARWSVERTRRDHAPRVDGQRFSAVSQQLQGLLPQIAAETSPDSLRGLEGIGAAAYFSVLDEMILQGKETFFEFRESGAVLLAEEGRRTFLQKWQERKRETITHPFLEEKLPWGLVPYVQSLLLARYLRGDLEEYPPFLWK